MVLRRLWVTWLLKNEKSEAKIGSYHFNRRITTNYYSDKEFSKFSLYLLYIKYKLLCLWILCVYGEAFKYVPTYMYASQVFSILLGMFEPYEWVFMGWAPVNVKGIILRGYKLLTQGRSDVNLFLIKFSAGVHSM